MGFRGMQFNFVISTNTRAIHLWNQLGFEIVGTLPGAFRHPEKGFVDVYVMYLSLLSRCCRDADNRVCAMLLWLAGTIACIA